MLHAVLNMPPALWEDSNIDKVQRYGRYMEASNRIVELETQLQQMQQLQRPVRHMRPIEVTEGQAANCRRSELYQLGDAVLVWVNERDIYMCGQQLPRPGGRKTDI